MVKEFIPYFYPYTDKTNSKRDYRLYILSNFLFTAFAHIPLVEGTLIRYVFDFRINSQRYFTLKHNAPRLG